MCKRRVKMKSNIISTVIMTFLYLVVYPMICSFFADFKKVSTIINLAVMALMIVFSLVRIHDVKDFKGYGVCAGDNAGKMKLILPLFILPIMNVPSLFMGANVTPMVTASAIYVGIMEELIFRGCVYKLVDDKWGEHKAIVFSSIAFGLIHLINLSGSGKYIVYLTILQVFYACAIGFAFAVVRARTGSILFPVIVHALVDIIGMADENKKFDVIFDSCACVVLIAFGTVYYVKYRKETGRIETAA